MKNRIDGLRAEVALHNLLGKFSAHVHQVSRKQGIVRVELDPTDASVLAELAEKGLNGE